MAEPHEIPWREMVAVLHRRRTLVLQVFGAGLATVILGAWLQGPSYRATATLMVTSDRAKVAVSPDANTRPVVDRVTDEDLNSEAELLKSAALIRDVLEPLYDENAQHDRGGLGARAFSAVMSAITFPIRLPGILYRVVHGIPAATALDNWVASTASHVTVDPIGRSNLIEVSFEDEDPAWAAEFVNLLVARHIERHTKLNQQSEAKRFYESQRQLLGERSQKAERALQEFYEREGVEAMPEQRTAIRTRLAELETQLAASETELAEGTARVKFLSQEIRNYPKSVATESRVAQSGSVQVIKPRIVELELQRSELLSRYAPTSVKIQDIERQIAEAKRLLAAEKDNVAETTSAVNPAYQTLEVDLAQTKAQMAAVGARVETLKAQRDAYHARVAHLDAVGSEQERLEQDVASAKEGYVTYAKKEEEARFSSALDESSIVNIAIAEPARAPASPEKSKRLMVVGLGAVMSLMAGIGLAFVRDRLDPAVKNAAEARDVTGLPILAELSR